MKEMDILAYLSRLKKGRKYTEEQLRLIEEDLHYGMSAEDVERYCEQGYDDIQMRVYSLCLRKGFSDEAIHTICKKGFSGQQMKVSMEYFEKGIPLETIGKMAAGERTAAEMQKAYLCILEQLEKAEEAAKGEPEYVKKLVNEIKNTIDKINYQEQRYDLLNKKLAEMESGKRQENVTRKMKAEMEEKDAMLSHQQDELNQAKAAIARLRKEVETLNEEKSKIDKQKVSVAAVKNNPIIESAVVESLSGATDHIVLPEGFQGVITDNQGNITHLQKEKVQIKRSRLVELFAKFAFRKKSRQDIIHMVISGELDIDQLTQIRVALGKGLKENQLVDLIHSKISAGQMAEIIEIAVLENRLAD